MHRRSICFGRRLSATHVQNAAAVACGWSGIFWQTKNKSHSNIIKQLTHPQLNILKPSQFKHLSRKCGASFESTRSVKSCIVHPHSIRLPLMMCLWRRQLRKCRTGLNICTTSQLSPSEHIRKVIDRSHSAIFILLFRARSIDEGTHRSHD